MTNVLLVLSPASDAPRAVSDAVQHARDAGGRLIVLTVVNPALTARVGAALTDVGFVGEQVSDDVMHTLAREQQAHAEALLHRIGEQAKRAGVPFTPLIETGDPSEVCARVIAEHHVRHAVLVAEKRSWLTRILARSATVRLPAVAGCEVEVVEEE